MNKLLNSAMMPNEGTYRLRSVSTDEFVERLRAEPFESYIGYDSTAEFIERLAGVSVPVSRKQTTIQSGDVLLVVRLKYRLADAGQKRDPNRVPADEDFEFFVCDYE